MVKLPLSSLILQPPLQLQQQRRILWLVGFCGIFLILQQKRFSSVLEFTSSPSSSSSSSNETTTTANTKSTTTATTTTSALPLCSREEIMDGVWHPITLSKPPYKPTYHAQRCYSDEDLLMSEERPTWNTYEWRPSHSTKKQCHFTRWNTTEFCHLAANKTILFVGDSLTLEHFSALLHLLNFTSSTTNNNNNLDDIWDKKNSETNFVYENLCNQNNQNNNTQNTAKLIFRRSFYLEQLNGGVLLKELQPDLLILNRGAWDGSMPDSKFKESITHQLSMVRKWQRQQQDATTNSNSNSSSSSKQRRHFIWRTTVPGHPHCWNYTKPATNLKEMEDLVANKSLYSEKGKKDFYWWKFRERNQLVLDLLLGANGTSTSSDDNYNNLDYDVMDAYEINLLRPDDHSQTVHPENGEVDCLHSCEPGKAIVYNELLLHFMKKQKQKQREREREAARHHQEQRLP